MNQTPALKTVAGVKQIANLTLQICRMYAIALTTNARTNP